MAEYIVGASGCFSVTEVLNSSELVSGDVIKLTKISYESLTFDKERFTNFGTLTIDLGSYAIWSAQSGNSSTVNIPKDIAGFTVRFKNGTLYDDWGGTVFKVYARAKKVRIELENVQLISNGRPVEVPDREIFSIVKPNPMFFLMLGTADSTEVPVNKYLDLITVSVEAPIVQVYAPNKYVYDCEKNPPEPIHEINDRLIDIVGYLPSNLRETQMAEFIKLFQDFLNYKLYKTADPRSGWDIPISVLKKIEKILDNKSPDDIDPDFLHNFAMNLGYNLNFTEETYNTIYGDESFIVPFMRNVCRTLPYFYANKSTERIFKSFLAMFGVKVDFKKLYSDEEYKVFVAEDSDGLMLTPHFGVQFIINDSGMTVGSNIHLISEVIQRSKPINTVFEEYNLVLNFDGYIAQNKLKDDFNWNPSAGEKRKYLYAARTTVVKSGYVVIGSNGDDLASVIWDENEQEWKLKNAPQPRFINSNGITVHLGGFDQEDKSYLL